MRPLTRSAVRAALAFAVSASAAVWADPVSAKVPSSLAYSLFLDGERVGSSVIQVRETRNALVFDSTVRVVTATTQIELTCHTEADPRTFRVRHFSYTGKKGGQPAEATVTLDGDTATGWSRMAGETRRETRTNSGGFVVFEDWVMELEVLIALRHGVSPNPTDTARLLFASSMLPADVTIGLTGEVLVESNGRSVVGRRLQVAIQGSAPFESRVDPETGLPLYLRFPGVRAEAFRDDFFGDNPESGYHRAASPPTGQ